MKKKLKVPRNEKYDLILEEKYLKIYCNGSEHLYFKSEPEGTTFDLMECGCTPYGIAKRRKKNGR